MRLTDVPVPAYLVESPQPLDDAEHVLDIAGAIRSTV